MKKNGVKRSLGMLLVVGSLLLVMGCGPEYSAEPLSVRLAHSEMARVPDASRLDFQPAPKWDYASAVELLGMLRVSEQYGDASLEAYIKQWADTMVAADGTIRGYKPEKYNIDHVCPGKLLLELYRLTGEPRFKTAADQLAKQMTTHPRTSEGAYWHKAVYPNQIWLDGLYMGAPFLAAYARQTNAADSVWADIARQYCVCARHTRDDSTGLYRHGWDEAKQMFWCDSTGRSRHAWGRANGWFMVGMMETLEQMPTGVAGRDTVEQVFAALADTLLKVRDEATGMWYQVLDAPGREGNFVESSASAMFIYCYLKGSRLGLLPERFRQVGREALSRFVERFVVEDTTSAAALSRPAGALPLLSVSDCNAVSGLGGKDMRDGSFKYYITSPMRADDPKTYGPLLSALVEVEM